jgi:hypothetical protein
MSFRTSGSAFYIIDTVLLFGTERNASWPMQAAFAGLRQQQNAMLLTSLIVSEADVCCTAHQHTRLECVSSATRVVQGINTGGSLAEDRAGAHGRCGKGRLCTWLMSR